MDKKWIAIIVLVLAVAILTNVLISKQESKELVVPRIDTIPFYMPVLKDSVVIRYEVVKLPISGRDTIYERDTIVQTDSVYVTIPITQKVYEDSLYTAYVSGYNPSLDSIRIYDVKTITKPIKPKKWGLGFHVGYGISKQGLTPYFGVGVSCNFVRW